MAGINRASGIYRIFSKEDRSEICIFLSHQKDDKEICKKISEYILAANMDVYFDENDTDLKVSHQQNNPDAVVNCIKEGINRSTHMLVIVSPSTVKSSWVPWEIGYGYDKTQLGVLTLKGMSDDLPHYLRTTRVIRGTKTLNSYLASIQGSPESLMENRNLIKSYSMAAHPLDNYLDYNK